MTNIGKYSRPSNRFAIVFQKQPEPRQYIELCSIRNKDNYALLENTPSQTDIISKAFSI